MCFLHSQVPLRLPSGLQPTARHPRQLPSNSSGSWRQRACFDTPLPLWCTRLCPGPSRLHKRELKVQSHSRGHWNPHSNLEFDFGGAARVCASCARAGGSRCHRRTADGRRGAFSSTALQLTLHAAAAWTPRGRGCELHVRSASKSPHFTPWVPDKPLLEALSCLRGIGVPSLPPPYSRIGAASIRPK